MGFDLHTHTTASDGTLKPKELVALAKNKGLEGIAITDHDTTLGIEEALEAGNALNITVLPGIEISTTFRDEEVHILGYLLDWQNIALQKKLTDLREERKERAKKMITRLNKLGYPLDYGEVQKIAGEGVIGRPHLAAALIKYGHVSSQEEAFNRFLDRGSLAYFPRKKLSLVEAIELLRIGKAVPILAHPGKIDNWSIIEPLIQKGLSGIEVYHPSNGKIQTEKLKKMCKLKGLIPTGGTDFHEERSETILGSIKVGSAIVELLKNKQEDLYV